MRRKKTLAISAAVGILSACLLLAACGHEHTPGEITCTLEEHSYVCTDCGKTVTGAHTFDDESFCEGCGFTVYDNGDGWFNVVGYDAYGGIASDVFYDNLGRVQSEMFYMTDYDQDGNEEACATYSDGILIHAVFYKTLHGENYFNHYIDKEYSYEGDTKTMTVYDQWMNPTRVAIMDLEDNVITDTTYEYQLDEDGNVLYCAMYVDQVLAGELENFEDARGNIRCSYDKTYENGELINTLSYEYDFADDGVLMAERELINDVLVREARYDLSEDGWEYLSIEIYYDEYGDVSEEYHYDADGNMIE